MYDFWYLKLLTISKIVDQIAQFIGIHSIDRQLMTLKKNIQSKQRMSLSIELALLQRIKEWTGRKLWNKWPLSTVGVGSPGLALY